MFGLIAATCVVVDHMNAASLIKGAPNQEVPVRQRQRLEAAARCTSSKKEAQLYFLLVTRKQEQSNPKTVVLKIIDNRIDNR